MHVIIKKYTENKYIKLEKRVSAFGRCANEHFPVYLENVLENFVGTKVLSLGDWPWKRGTKSGKNFLS